MVKEESENGVISMLIEHRHRLFSYIYTLVPHRADAEDILQAASVVIWEKRAEFEGGDFFAWASRVAYWEARAARTKFARSKVVFDDKVFEAVAEAAGEVEGLGGEGAGRQGALQACLGELDPRDRDTVLARYAEDGGVEHAAERSGRSTVATYKALSRLRRALFNCVNAKLASAAT